MTRRRPSARGRWTRTAPASEWIGATFTAPFEIHDRPDPYRPGIALWLELPAGFVLGQEVFHPDEADGALARALRSSMAAPAVGPPRQPDAIRVADEAAAGEVRAEVGSAIPITIAPTPEVNEVRDALLEAMADLDGDIEPSYLEDGRIPASAVAALFEAGCKLFALRPWTLGEESPELRMDIPALDVEGACVVIIGQADDVHGVLIFPSLDDFDSFLLASETERYKEGDLGAEVLSLTYESATEIPPSMRREAMEHGWRVESPEAYPIVMRSGPDGLPQTPTCRDLEIATACAEALAAFVGRHAAILSAVDFAAVSESYVDKEGREVQLTAPYEDQDDFEHADFGVDAVDDFSPLADDGPFTPRAGRNEPCPCGNGRKYKKCHLPTDQARHAEGRRANLLHWMDTELTVRMMEFAADEFGEAWRKVLQGMGREAGPAILEATIAVYSLELNETTVVDAYLEARSSDCSADEREWLEAQRRAWWSVWEVEAVEPGWTLSIVDLLTGERRTVLDRSASRGVGPRDALLARVVDHDALSLFTAILPSVLPPFDAAEVVEQARRKLRRKRAVPPERLRDGRFANALVRYWQMAVEALRLRSRRPAPGSHPEEPRPKPATLTPDEERLAAEFKAGHYAEWPDIPVPALGDRTPRECARSAAGRREVDLLLKQMEHMEERASYGKPFDFSILRGELGIPG